MAELFEAKFLEKTAGEWEAELEASGLPAAKIQSWPEWFKDKDAKNARIVADVDGLDYPQLGRTAWLRSVGEYPNLKALETAASLLKDGSGLKFGSGSAAARPLEGVVLADFANVIAGPACGRMFAELGATVYKMGPGLPQHGPMVMMVWQAELHQGKKSIILDAKKPDAKKVITKMLQKADIVLLNKMDNQLVQLGLNRESLDIVNKKAILVQLKSHAGERYDYKSNWNGYDPALQGKTGLMTRFGPPGCPNFHGVASCVDYLTGYMAAWGALAGLYAREANGLDQGDWVQSSLAVCASLTQLDLQVKEPPATAVGCHATGMTPYNRVFKVGSGKYIYGQAPEGTDIDALITKLSTLDQSAAIAHFDSAFGKLAVPVQTVKEIAEICSDGASITADFKKKNAGQGWLVETWEPTWFCFDGKPFSCLSPPTFSGSDAPQVLAELGYSKSEVMGLQQSRAVVPTNWYKWGENDTLMRGPSVAQVDLLEEGLE